MKIILKIILALFSVKDAILMSWKSIINISLRGLTISSRFLLTFVIAKYMSVEELGTYSLVNTTIMIGVIIIGLDFYTFANRNFLEDKKNSIKVLFNQFFFYFFIYILIIFGSIIIYLFFQINGWIVFIVTILLINEHFSQELYRLFIISGYPILANSLLFIRSGLWGIFAIVILITVNATRNLEFILNIWVLGSTLSLIVSIIVLLKINKDILTMGTYNIDFKVIIQGIKISIPFFISTVFLKVTEYLDRFIITIFSGQKQLGIYVFYYNIANIIPVFVFTSVGMFLYPKAIHYLSIGEINKYKSVIKRMYKSSIISMVFLIIFSILVVKISLMILKNDNLVQNEPLFYLMLVQMFFIVLAQLAHYELYAQKKDKIILFSTVISSLSAIIFNLLLIPLIGIYGATIAGIVSFTALFILKHKYSKLEN